MSHAKGENGSIPFPVRETRIETAFSSFLLYGFKQKGYECPTIHYFFSSFLQPYKQQIRSINGPKFPYNKKTNIRMHAKDVLDSKQDVHVLNSCTSPTSWRRAVVSWVQNLQVIDFGDPSKESNHCATKKNQERMLNSTSRATFTAFVQNLT